MGTHSPLAAANWFLARHGETGIEHMKLQKLVYCAHGWWLAFKTETFLNERPQVWKYGPVFSSLYHVLKPYGREPIHFPVAISPFEAAPVLPDDEFEGLMMFVWARYGHLSSFALSEMTHERNSAWYKQADQHGFEVPHGLEISDAFVRAEFLKIYMDEKTTSPKTDAA